jgi:HAD superfamily hydrolase (TIGR01549 family)
MHEPLAAGIPFTQPVEAVLLDVDGTLYYQDALRCLMALELSVLPLQTMSLKTSRLIWRSLRDFRRVREDLRRLGEAQDRLAELQFSETARRTGEQPAIVEAVAVEWMYRRPLKYLRFCRRHGVEAFFSFLEQKTIRVGVFSDYPVVDKLNALGLSERISPALSAIDPEINAFKPHPKGFLLACAGWGLPPEKVLYVGDRPDVDAIGAAQAGMPCAILSSRAHRASQPSVRQYLRCTSLYVVQRAVAYVF